MNNFFFRFSAIVLFLGVYCGISQIYGQDRNATLAITSEEVIVVPSIASQIENGTFKPGVDILKEVNPKRWGKNIAVPGKGLPKDGDPLLEKQTKAVKSQGKAPILTFNAASASSTPTDPTGAVGPDHFMNSWNSSFRIWDKSGNALIPVSSLGTIFPGTMGDPIVMYDRYADRFFISEFFSDGFDVAVSQGPDPVNDGWYVYRYNTSSFPDYPKYSIWSDGYYITANKDQSSPTTNEVVFALERDAMLTGDPTAQMIGFSLPGIVNNGFYSPLGFNCNGPALPPPGNAPIVYMQDDVWSGVSTDHLKIWSINVDWSVPSNSTISSPQIINTTPFDGLFDNGSFSNLPQPSGSDIDALQATIMYMAQYRRFTGYNSVVFNFVVDLDGNDDYSGIRWYELRQTADGDPWSIYQEGTYAQPDGHSAFCGNMCMDANGNIGLAYTTVSTSLFPSLRYTGRLASDPPGTMTLAEEVIGNGTQVDPSFRYGDYAQMTIDPTDDVTFWSIGEYFTSGTRVNRVGVFNIAPPPLTAEFFAAPTLICKDGSVTFTDASTGSPTSWEWTFTGGTPASYTGQNPPPVTYSTPGTYQVKLVVGDGVDTDEEIKNEYINVKSIIADFSASITSVIVGNTVTFSDNSECSPDSWYWEFEGGIPSTFTGQNPPAIQYDTEGTYDVTLTVINTAGSDTKTITDYISVEPPVFLMQDGTITTCGGQFYDAGGPSGPYFNNEDYILTFYPSTAGSQLEFVFTQFDVEANSTCSWDYLNIYNGENISSPLIGQYCGTDSPGTVTSSNASGAITFEWHSDGSVTDIGWTALVNCTTNPPVAEFEASTTTPSPGATVIITDLSAGGPTSWTWSIEPATFGFVNGTNANSQNPEIQFSETGLYDITLTTTNNYGSDTETKIGYIDVIPCTYCAAGGSIGDEEWISNVTFNTINNSSNAGAGYTNYTDITTDVEPGSTHEVFISCGSDGSYTEQYWVFFDWNQDCDFDDLNEGYDLGQTTGPGTLSTSVVIPESAQGIIRMRVFIKYSSDPLDGCDTYTYGEVEDYNINVIRPVDLQLTLFLEGPFNGTIMDPRITEFLPLQQPYNQAPWNYAGTESITSPSPEYIDWILVELRDATSASQATGSTAIARKAVFLTSTGQVIDNEGNTILGFDETVSNDLFVVIYHRNHIRIMSANAVPLAGDVYSYDFSSSGTQVYGGVNGHKELAPGIWGMISADGNSDGIVNTLDQSPLWENEAGQSGFLDSDYNLDGQSDNKDKDDHWLPNLGKGDQIPE